MGRIVRIVKSFFALPVWVIVWISLFLVPANYAGLFYLHTPVGFWVALLGAGAITLNLVVVWVNGGFSKVLAIPHLVFWVPLQIILGVKLLSGLVGAEWWLAVAVFIVNGISLFFDIYDTREWMRGNRSVAGFPGYSARW